MFSNIEIYTDGSKDKNKVATAAVMNKDIFSARLPDEAAIFSAKAKAIKLAFEFIKMSKYIYILQYFQIHFLVYSLHSMNIDHPYI